MIIIIISGRHSERSRRRRSPNAVTVLVTIGAALWSGAVCRCARIFGFDALSDCASLRGSGCCRYWRRSGSRHWQLVWSPPLPNAIGVAKDHGRQRVWRFYGDLLRNVLFNVLSPHSALSPAPFGAGVRRHCRCCGRNMSWVQRQFDGFSGNSVVHGSSRAVVGGPFVLLWGWRVNSLRVPNVFLHAQEIGTSLFFLAR